MSVEPKAGALVVLPADNAGTYPAVIANHSGRARKRFIEFFTAQIRNRNTREAYLRAVSNFFGWCDQCGLALEDIEPVHVAAYVELLITQIAAPSVKQHLAAIRMLFDWLVTGQVVAYNPASSVRGPKHSVKRGKTPVLTAEEAKQLIESIDVSTVVGLRDRALIATMLYSFARVSAVCGMRVQDYYAQGKRFWLRLHEKGGKFHEVPCHHKAEGYLDAYLEAAGIRENRKSPLFRSTRGRTQQLTEKQLSRTDAFRIVQRRMRASELKSKASCHSFRATGITVFLENGGALETAAQIAAHESPRTTKLYDRTNDDITLEEIERIRL